MATPDHGEEQTHGTKDIAVATPDHGEEQTHGTKGVPWLPRYSLRLL